MSPHEREDLMKNEQIVDFLTECGANGATAEEVSKALEIPLSTAGARISELVNLRDKLVPNGQRRPTATGKLARVYVLRDPATPAQNRWHALSSTVR
jgi:hypothetical protein